MRLDLFSDAPESLAPLNHFQGFRRIFSYLAIFVFLGIEERGSGGGGGRPNLEQRQGRRGAYGRVAILERTYQGRDSRGISRADVAEALHGFPPYRRIAFLQRLDPV